MSTQPPKCGRNGCNHFANMIKGNGLCNACAEAVPPSHAGDGSVPLPCVVGCGNFGNPKREGRCNACADAGRKPGDITEAAAKKNQKLEMQQTLSDKLRINREKRMKLRMEESTRHNESLVRYEGCMCIGGPLKVRVGDAMICINCRRCLGSADADQNATVGGEGHPDWTRERAAMKKETQYDKLVGKAPVTAVGMSPIQILIPIILSWLTIWYVVTSGMDGKYIAFTLLGVCALCMIVGEIKSAFFDGSKQKKHKKHKSKKSKSAENDSSTPPEDAAAASCTISEAATAASSSGTTEEPSVAGSNSKAEETQETQAMQETVVAS